MTDYADTAAADAAKSKLKDAAASAQDAYGSLMDVAAATVSETRDRVKDLAAEAAGRLERRYDDLQAWVQLRPTQALGVAAGVGVLLGLLLRGAGSKTVYVRDRR